MRNSERQSFEKVWSFERYTVCFKEYITQISSILSRFGTASAQLGRIQNTAQPINHEKCFRRHTLEDIYVTSVKIFFHSSTSKIWRKLEFLFAAFWEKINQLCTCDFYTLLMSNFYTSFVFNREFNVDWRHVEVWNLLTRLFW